MRWPGDVQSQKIRRTPAAQMVNQSVRRRMEAVRSGRGAVVMAPVVPSNVREPQRRPLRRVRRGGGPLGFSRSVLLPLSTCPQDLGLTVDSAPAVVERALLRLATSHCLRSIRVLRIQGVQVRGERLVGLLLLLLRRRPLIYALNWGEQAERPLMRPVAADVWQLQGAIQRGETGLIGVYVCDVACRGEMRRQLRLAVRHNRQRLQDRALRLFQRSGRATFDVARAWAGVPWRHPASVAALRGSWDSRRGVESQEVAGGMLGFSLEMWGRERLDVEPLTPAGRWPALFQR